MINISFEKKVVQKSHMSSTDVFSPILRQYTHFRKWRKSTYIHGFAIAYTILFHFTIRNICLPWVNVALEFIPQATHIPKNKIPVENRETRITKKWEKFKNVH
jgi:hypothetical protein